MKKVYIKPITECTKMDASQLFATSLEVGGDTTNDALIREDKGMWEHSWK